jgi:hypothetical protein
VKKRSKYKPKGVVLDAMAHVKSGLQSLRCVGDQITILRIKNHGALSSLANGDASKDDADIIITAMNIADALIRMGVGEPHAKEMRQAQDAILSMARRGVANGYKFGFNTEELEAVNWAMEIHEAQLDAINIGQLEKAVDMVKKIIMGGGTRKVTAI